MVEIVTDDTVRLRTLKTGLLAGCVCQKLSGWFTQKDFARAYREDVGPMNRRSTFRYLSALEQVGIIEMQDRRDKGDPLRYRWVGWPT